MGKRWYRQPHWWFNTRLEHTPARSFGHMFRCLPTRRASHFLTASPPSWQVDANLDIQPDNIKSRIYECERWCGRKQVI